MYRVKLSKRAMQDREKILQAGLGKQVKALIEVLRNDPYKNPPAYEKLVGDLKGFYSRRINRQHRLVYTVHEEEKTVAIRSMWTHYEISAEKPNVHPTAKGVGDSQRAMNYDQPN